MWSPDGKTIAFERSNRDSQSIWTANVDGSSQRQIASQAVHPMWSPDSKSLAYKRTIPGEAKEKLMEIFAQDLSSGKEQQMTFQKKDIGSYCWASTDKFIYNFTQGTNANFWVVPAKGGIAKQLTSDMTINRVPRLSKDAQRLVYQNSSSSENLWTADATTKELRQLTFEDGSLDMPIFSLKGDKIIYTKRTFDRYYELFVSNADGNEGAQICSLKVSKWDERFEAYTLSGDERAIAYCVMQLDSVLSKGDTIRWYRNIFLLDLEKNTTQHLGEGGLIDWSLDRKYMLVAPQADFKPQFNIVSPDSLDKPIRQFNIRSWKSDPSFTHDSKKILYADSTQLWSMDIESGQRTFICELPKGTWWVREMPDGKSIGIGTAPPRRKGIWTAYIYSILEKKLNKLLEVTGDFYQPSYSPDMKTFIVSKEEARNKIVVVDNFR